MSRSCQSSCACIDVAAALLRCVYRPRQFPASQRHGLRRTKFGVLPGKESSSPEARLVGAHHLPALPQCVTSISNDKLSRRGAASGARRFSAAEYFHACSTAPPLPPRSGLAMDEGRGLKRLMRDFRGVWSAVACIDSCIPIFFMQEETVP